MLEGLGVFVIAWWLMLALFVGYVGEKRGRNGFLWFIASILFSPLLALVGLMVLPSLYSFKPDAVYKGVPYLKSRLGWCVALIDGTRVLFSNEDGMKLTIDGGSVAQ